MVTTLTEKRGKPPLEFLDGLEDANPGETILLESTRSHQLVEVTITELRGRFICCTIRQKPHLFMRRTGKGYNNFWNVVATGDKIDAYRARHRTPNLDEDRSLLTRERFDPRFSNLVSEANILSERIKMHLQIDQYDIALDILSKAAAARGAHQEEIKHALFVHGIDCPIELLRLPQRTENSLTRHGVTTINRLCSMTEEDFRRHIYHVKDDGMRTIADTLELHGFTHKLGHLCSVKRPFSDEDEDTDAVDEQQCLIDLESKRTKLDNREPRRVALSMSA